MLCMVKQSLVVFGSVVWRGVMCSDVKLCLKGVKT